MKSGSPVRSRASNGLESNSTAMRSSSQALAVVAGSPASDLSAASGGQVTGGLSPAWTVQVLGAVRVS